MNSVEWQGATPEQINLWDKVVSLLVGVQTITPIYYAGSSVASEFVTYDAKKLYLALEFKTGQYTLSSPLTWQTYDEANAISMSYVNTNMAWDTTGAVMKYVTNFTCVKNIYFSRIVALQYIVFNGYKITIP
jgi:hypothetical protein